MTCWALSKLGWEYTHVGLRLGPCVYEIRLDTPSEWVAETNYRKVYPDTVCLEWQQPLDLTEVCEMLPTGVRFQLLPSIREYMERPAFAPQAWNCLSASRKMLEHLGRPSNATTPDQLYREVLDLRSSLLRDRQTT